MINDLAAQVASLERDLAHLRHEPSAASEQMIQIRTRERYAVETIFLSVPVYMDTPGLGCFDDFANALCRSNVSSSDWICMSMSPWQEAMGGGYKDQLRRPIKFIDGIVAAESIDCNVVRQAILGAWDGALFPKTTVGELCFNHGIHGSDELAGFVQKTPYGGIWAGLIEVADDSGYLHPDGYTGERFKEDEWIASGHEFYDCDPRAWFAEFSVAIAHDNFRLSSNKSRNKLEALLRRIPTPY